jgi:hypothetical protein
MSTQDFADLGTLRVHELSGDYDKWNSEKEMKCQLLDILLRCSEIQVFDEPRLIDIYDNQVRADIGIVVRRREQDCFFAIELKNRAQISANASAAYSQAYHYRDMCIVTDDRLPKSVRGRSPSLAFAGLFDMRPTFGGEPAASHHQARWFGINILCTHLKVGSVRKYKWHDNVAFYFGEMCLFTVDGYDGGVRWNHVIDNYIFGSEKRNGSRRARQSVAERFVEVKTLAELF